MKPAALIVVLLCCLLGGCLSRDRPSPEEHELVPVEIHIGKSSHPGPKNLFLSVDCFQDYAGVKNADRTKDRELARGRLNREGIYWISLPKQPARYLRISVNGGGSDDGSWLGLIDVYRTADRIEKPIQIFVEWHSDTAGMEIFEVPR